MLPLGKLTQLSSSSDLIAKYFNQQHLIDLSNSQGIDFESHKNIQSNGLKSKIETGSQSPNFRNSLILSACDQYTKDRSAKMIFDKKKENGNGNSI